MVKSSMNKINNSKIHQTVSLYDRWRFNLQSEINAEMSVEHFNNQHYYFIIILKLRSMLNFSTRILIF